MVGGETKPGDRPVGQDRTAGARDGKEFRLTSDPTCDPAASMFPQSSLGQCVRARDTLKGLQNGCSVTPSILLSGAAPHQTTEEADLQVL